MCMLNLIGSNGSRFIRLPEARGMAALQIKRIASSDFPRTYDSDDLGRLTIIVYSAHVLS